MVPLYLARIEDLGQVDFEKSVAPDAVEGSRGVRQNSVARIRRCFSRHSCCGSPQPIEQGARSLKGRVRCRACGVQGRDVILIKQHDGVGANRGGWDRI
jgi:hypothetical protein